MGDTFYHSPNFRASHIQSSPQIRPILSHQYSSPILNDSDSSSPFILRQMSLASYSKNSCISSPIKSDSTIGSYLQSHSRWTLDTPKENDIAKNPENTPKGVSNFNEEEMDEFGNAWERMSLKKHLSEKVPASNLVKKSMNDVITRVSRTRSMASLPQADMFETETFSGPAVKIAPTRARADSASKRSFFKVEGKDTRLRVSSPVKIERRTQEDVSILDLNEGFPGGEPRNLKDLLILEKVLGFLDFSDSWRLSKLCYCFRNIKVYKKLFLKRFYHFFGNGLSQKEQIWFWSNVVSFRQLRNYYPFAYSQHFAKKCAYFNEINKDIDRTLPEYSKFSTPEVKGALLRVLMAISNTIKDMGYIQGLNSVAGTFLYYLKEEESFWILLYFMEKLKFKELLKEDFKKINLLNYQLQIYLEYYLPDVAHHFENETGISYLTTPWFLTLFSYSLSIPNVIKIWNFLFTKGLSYLIQFTLAIFSKHKEMILRMDMEQIGTFLKNEMRNLPDDERSLFKSALNIRVSNKILKEIETAYINGAKNLHLIMDQRGRPKLLCEKKKPKIEMPSLRPNTMKQRATTTIETPLSQWPGRISMLIANKRHYNVNDFTNGNINSNGRLSRGNSHAQFKAYDSHANVSIEDDAIRSSGRVLETKEDYTPSCELMNTASLQHLDIFKRKSSLISLHSSESPYLASETNLHETPNASPYKGNIHRADSLVIDGNKKGNNSPRRTNPIYAKVNRQGYEGIVRFPQNEKANDNLLKYGRTNLYERRESPALEIQRSETKSLKYF